MATINTKILILSDTHGQQFLSGQKPTQSYDVVIHCGDLTEGSQLHEFRTTLQLLQELDAPLKLVIAGNHDFTLDIPAFERKIHDAYPPLEQELVSKHYGDFGEANALFARFQTAGIVLLDEGRHHFTLTNGAQLKVYASPYTPSYGAWGYQYRPDSGHKFDVPDGTDVVITHGPPKGVMDRTAGGERAGCPDLFAAVAKARPLLHCFGHIHEGWGGKVVQWRPKASENPSHFADINHEQSKVLETLSTLRPSPYDSTQEAQKKLKRAQQYQNSLVCSSSQWTEAFDGLESGKQTIFINASIQGEDGTLEHKPWEVKLKLHSYSSDSV